MRDAYQELLARQRKSAGKPRTRSHEESELQIACVRWFRYQHPSVAPLLFAVPNGGVRNAVTASILKAEGVVAGVADLLLLVPSGGWHGLAIEMKTPTGRQSERQRAWQRAVEGQGYLYAVCRSVEGFITTVEGYLADGKGR